MRLSASSITFVVATFVAASFAGAQRTNDPSMLGGAIGPRVTGTAGPGSVTVTLDPLPAPQVTNNQFVAAWMLLGHQAEIALGRLAESRATTEEVRDFARMMVHDHAVLMENLQRVAGRSPGAVATGGKTASGGPATPGPTFVPGPGITVDGIRRNDPAVAAANRAAKESLFEGRASDAVQGENNTVPSGVAWTDRTLPGAARGGAGGPAGSSVGASSRYRAGLATMASRDATPMQDLDRGVENARLSFAPATSETSVLRSQLAYGLENRVAVPGNPAVQVVQPPVPPPLPPSPELAALRPEPRQLELAQAEAGLARRSGVDFDRAYLAHEIAAQTRLLAALQGAREHVGVRLQLRIDDTMTAAQRHLGQARKMVQMMDEAAVQAAGRPAGGVQR